MTASSPIEVVTNAPNAFAEAFRSASVISAAWLSCETTQVGRGLSARMKMGSAQSRRGIRSWDAATGGGHKEASCRLLEQPQGACLSRKQASRGPSWEGAESGSLRCELGLKLISAHCRCCSSRYAGWRDRLWPSRPVRTCVISFDMASKRP